MSSSLVWEPVNRKTKFLEDSVKFALRKKYGDPVDAVLSGDDVPYLQGLRDAGIKGIDALLEAIEKHHEIEVKEVY